ncbi:hypothetical protein, partial [Pseudomonas lactis]|uniref:hypothetical protein n=1 Tax=Pseudomonas lactis TaxID=1615674 RepID=UPI001F19E057
IAGKPAPTEDLRRQDISHNCFRLSLGISLNNLWTVAANSATGFDRPTLLTNCYALHLFRRFFCA